MMKFVKQSYYDRVNKIIDGLQLMSKNDNEIIKNRFLYEVLLYENKRDQTKKYYNGFRFTVTIGSILLPAILSIGQMDPEKLPDNFDDFMYWASWIISLSVTASNGFVQLFSLDKNYYTYSMVTEQLKTEGWQYFQLSGKYRDSENHIESFKPFCYSIENIKKKQIETEFSGGKAGDKKKFDFKRELAKEVPNQYKSTEQQNMKPKNDTPRSEESGLNFSGFDPSKMASSIVEGIAETGIKTVIQELQPEPEPESVVLPKRETPEEP